jgi:prepilin-type N-terminal cleavage/methylation domain-containing protein
MLRGKGPASEVGCVKSGKRGFTLIELMLVVAIIGLLASIALPKFVNLVEKSKEASTKGKLGVLRNTLAIYFADNEGTVPSFAWDSSGHPFVPKYIDVIPNPDVPHRAPPSDPPTVGLAGQGEPWGMGFRVVWALNPGTQNLYVLCQERDSTGRTWSTW